MKVLRSLLSLFLLVFSLTVFAKNKNESVFLREIGRQNSLHDTSLIEFAEDVLDPDRPWLKSPEGKFKVYLYRKSNKAWNSLGSIQVLDTLVSGEKIRLAVDEPGTTLILKKVVYWPGVQWYQPLSDFLQMELKPKQFYEFTVPIAQFHAGYRLSVTKERQTVSLNLEEKLFGKRTYFEVQSLPERLYCLDENEPMSHLARIYAYWTVHKGQDVRKIRSLYWRCLATGWSMVMGETSPMDKDGYYHSKEWFFDQFGYALFSDLPWPDLRICDHVLWFDERPEPYVIRKRTFDINDVQFLDQKKEGENLVLKLRVKKDHGPKDVLVYLSPADRDKHPFAWKIDKGDNI